MLAQTRRYFKRFSIALLIMLCILFTLLVLRRPVQLSDRLLRFGGRFITLATSNINRVAAVSGCAIVLLWCGISIALYREKPSGDEQPE